MHKIVTEVLQECIDAEAAFSSHDIISESRDRGCKLLKHEIEQIIQDYENFPRYYKTSQLIGPNGEHILVRHPANVNPRDYDMSDIKEIQLSKPKLMVDIPMKTGESRASILARHSLFDRRNRFGVPASDIRAAGFSAGECLALVYDSSNRIVIMPEREIEDKNEIKTVQTVDHHFGIRVKKHHFQTVCNDVPTDIRVEISPRKLTLIPQIS